MREIVGVTLEPEASDLEKGEEEIAIRQRIRESLVLEVQASDLEDMEQFKKGLPLEQGSLRQALGQAQWADSNWRPLCQRLMKDHASQGEEQGDNFRIGSDRTLEVAVSLLGKTTAQWVVVIPDGEVRGTKKLLEAVLLRGNAYPRRGSPARRQDLPTHDTIMLVEENEGGCGMVVRSLLAVPSVEASPTTFTGR